MSERVTVRWVRDNPAAAANRINDALAEGERRGLERAAAEIDCGCPKRAAVLAATTSADRCRACGREPCAAQQAQDIRATTKEPTT